MRGRRQCADQAGQPGHIRCMMKKLIIATTNEGKMREFRMLLGDEFGTLVSLTDVGFTQEIIEDGDTFEQNATIKASVVCQALHCAVLADDSGLCVDALQGGPGIFSARFSGGSAQDNNDFLLQKLEGIPVPRRAQYVAALALARPGHEMLVVRGECHGEIALERAGQGGFGYDPLFYLPEYGTTFGLLPLEQKNKMSHRALAVRALQEALSQENR